MSQESMQLSRAYLDDIARASQESLDPEATVSKMAKFWDPEIEWDMSEGPALDLSNVYRGTEAVQQLWREWFTAWGSFQVEYELVDAGDRVVWLIDLRMRGRSTGIEVPRGKHAWVATFKDGLIVHQKLYMSQSEALKAVGLKE
jgi:SnoaL-like domain